MTEKELWREKEGDRKREGERDIRQTYLNLLMFNFT
jgi:hypothetical protein